MHHFGFLFRVLHSINWKFGFHLPHVYIPGKIIVQVNGMTCLWVKTIILTANTRDYALRYQVLSEKVQSQYFSGCDSISMEGVALEHYNILKLSIISMTQFYSRLSDESDQYSITTATHLRILLQFILTKKL